MTHKTMLAVVAGGGLWLTSAAMAQEPKAPPAVPGRGEIRGEKDAPPGPRGGVPREGRPGAFGDPPRRPGAGGEPRGPLRDGEGRRGPEGRPGPGIPPDGPEGRGPGFGPRGGGYPGPFGPAISGTPVQDLRRMQQDDPEMYELLVADNDLNRQALDKAEQLRRATSETREKLKAELVEIVGQHFESRQKRRELQLKRMEEEIKRLRDAIEARNDAREEIVNKHITELTGDANPLDF